MRARRSLSFATNDDLGRFVSRSPLMRLLWIIQFEPAIRITVCGRRKPRRCPSRRQRRPQAVPWTVNSRSNVQQPRALLVPKRPSIGTSNMVRVFEAGRPPHACRQWNPSFPTSSLMGLDRRWPTVSIEARRHWRPKAAASCTQHPPLLRSWVWSDSGTRRYNDFRRCSSRLQSAFRMRSDAIDSS